ncbi:MAG TPA: iron-containing alcohol dehydrogenase [Candidatus Limnocylindrales bacterium]|nr:iron-containing alcohol dehydrogenase [Candidatus Limnocylindrales bacterium]
MTARRHLDPTDLAAVRAAVGLDVAGSRLHDVGLERIVIARDALDSLPELVRTALAAAGRLPGAETPSVAVVVDGHPMDRGGADLRALVVDRLEGVADVRMVVLGTADRELHAEASTIAAAVEAARGAACLVALGSGTICDIVKEASRELGVADIAVQTANSVNAFSDDMAVLLIRGVKRTVPSRWPTALLVDLTTIADAPARLNRAGVGELAAMFTAPADWRLAAAFGMDPTWDPRVVRLFTDGGDALLEAASAATSPEPDDHRPLVELMTLSGLALGIAGKTSPISGTEHTVSHLLDMVAAREHTPTGLHGAQVGVAALAVSVAWQRVLTAIDPVGLVERPTPSHERMLARTEDAFGDLDPSGAMAEECWAQYRLKLERWEAQRPNLPAIVSGWAALRDDLGEFLGSPQRVASVLSAAGAPARFDELDPAVSREDAAWALYNGHLIRDRFTLADLAWFAGTWTPDLVRASIDEAAAIAAAAGGA